MADFPIYLIQEGLTEDDLDQLGDSLAHTGIRFELDNGRLILMPPMKAWHMDVSRRLCNVLVAGGKQAYQEQGIRINKRKVRYPDIGVFWVKPDLDRSRHDAAAFSLVIEVVSPDSVEEDRVVKPRVYAGAGIPEYWIVDRHPTGRMPSSSTSSSAFPARTSAPAKRRSATWRRPARCPWGARRSWSPETRSCA